MGGREKRGGGKHLKRSLGRWIYVIVGTFQQQFLVSFEGRLPLSLQSRQPLLQWKKNANTSTYVSTGTKCELSVHTCTCSIKATCTCSTFLMDDAITSKSSDVSSSSGLLVSYSAMMVQVVVEALSQGNQQNCKGNGFNQKEGKEERNKRKRY